MRALQSEHLTIQQVSHISAYHGVYGADVLTVCTLLYGLRRAPAIIPTLWHPSKYVYYVIKMLTVI